MVQLHETKLPRFKLSNRRGVWTTWGASRTWGACLIRSDQRDLLPLLAQCPSVTELRNVTQEVFSKQFVPPERPWTLLVESPHQSWATFADDCGYNDALDALHAEFPGETLRTGSVDDFGTVYVRLWKNGTQLLEFTTDGMGWPTLPEDATDDDESDSGSVFIFNTDMYPNDWPHTLPRVEEAHQKLIIDRDAYVSGLIFVGSELSAAYGHDDVTDRANIERITLVQMRAKDA